MSKSRVLAVTTVLCILAGTAVSPARASLTDLWASERQQKRDTSDLRPYEEETSGLIAQFRILATSLKETMVNKLNVTNGSTLDPPSETTEVSFLRSALGTLCTMKPLLTALVAAEASVTAGVQFVQDREISTMQIIVAKLYQQTCEWMVSEARMDGSDIDAECLCTPVFSETAVELCTYWDALRIVEEAEKDLNTFLTML